MTHRPPLEAIYFDGKVASAHMVRVEIVDAELRLSVNSVRDDGGGLSATDRDLRQHYDQFQRCYPVHACQQHPPITDGPRMIALPDGGVLEIAPTASNLDYLTHSWPTAQGFSPRLHTYLAQQLVWMESHWLGVGLAMLGMALIFLWALNSGIPSVSDQLAKRMPPQIEQRLGQTVLDHLNQPTLGYFSPSRLSVAQQQAIRHDLTTFCLHSQCPPYQLVFKASNELGANAIALPGGTVIVTDALVTLAGSPPEVIAVLAHELAHIKYHHGLRQVLQTSVSALALFALTSDVSGLAAALPTLLVNMQFSRTFEEEADADALRQLKRACIPPRLFADMLAKLTAQQAPGTPLPELLASHPDPHKRMQPFLVEVPDCQRL